MRRESFTLIEYFRLQLTVSMTVDSPCLRSYWISTGFRAEPR